MKVTIWRSRKGSQTMDAEVIEIPGDYTDVLGTADIRFPHCDALILHSPGVCQFCDRHPDWQALRSAQGIAFSDMLDADRAVHGLLPCPSTYRRPADMRDRWPGNTASS